MSDQLADVFAKVNYGEHDTQDAQGVAEAMVEARNTSRHLLTEAAAEITALRARVAKLQAAIDAAKEEA
jgi:ABC-type transporter Mla subunit MlaD